jgi:hypothetical protein
MQAAQSVRLLLFALLCQLYVVTAARPRLGARLPCGSSTGRCMYCNASNETSLLTANNCRTATEWNCSDQPSQSGCCCGYTCCRHRWKGERSWNVLPSLMSSAPDWTSQRMQTRIPTALCKAQNQSGESLSLQAGTDSWRQHQQQRCCLQDPAICSLAAATCASSSNNPTWAAENQVFATEMKANTGPWLAAAG